MAGGFIAIGRWRGAPIRIHWTLPLGAAFFSGFELAPAFWAAFVLVLLFHLIGQAQMVRWLGLEPRSLDLHALGGRARWAGRTVPSERFGIAVSGIVAQGLLLSATLLAVKLLGRPTHPQLIAAVDALTHANVWVLLLNLLPIPPLDGAEAWPALWKTIQGARKMKRDQRSFDAVRIDYQRLEEVQSRRESAGRVNPAIEAEAREMWTRLTEDIRRARSKKEN